MFSHDRFDIGSCEAPSFRAKPPTSQKRPSPTSQVNCGRNKEAQTLKTLKVGILIPCWAGRRQFTPLTDREAKGKTWTSNDTKTSVVFGRTPFKASTSHKGPTRASGLPCEEKMYKSIRLRPHMQEESQIF
ncbi:hypothetical protein PAAG_11990 [Paracoccidioides lutzii Pb01]|uniref:Uncharacterized protein n=1 Tax=Paracoccidioides lutzii (strain ATCC MYA-826 / Pb01) TaxID=502779 RepID=A0A0A2V0I4_PARBA|nr:hypothetical protein PAAG_11990 [Paracoccidioides lutzii Pb01]KGQ01311.1 hypothetical protein PAAG_11990 [Paracoccidioides lutzii Pb01]